MINEAVIQSAKILVVDDERTNVRLIERILQRSNYVNIKSITDPRQAMEAFLELQPDLVILDLFMPHIDGYTLMAQLCEAIPENTYLPILVLTADASTQAKQRALSAGAKDFLTKPLNAVEVILRIKNLLKTRLLYLQIQRQNDVLEKRVRERTRDLEDAQVEVLKRLARAAEFRDDNTGHHAHYIGVLASQIAQILGMPADQVELIRLTAPLHDLGKIGIPDKILLKATPLTPEEFEQVKSHTTIGARILMGSHFAVLQMAEEIALTHHERWDGNGYPLRLQGEHIPLTGRIVAVADTFDTLTRTRPGKRALKSSEAIEIILRESGRAFDPNVVKAFLEIQNAYSSSKQEEAD